VLPRPRDARDPFDFSGARDLMDEAYELSIKALDEHAAELAERDNQRRRVTNLFVPKPAP